MKLKDHYEFGGLRAAERSPPTEAEEGGLPCPTQIMFDLTPTFP